MYLNLVKTLGFLNHRPKNVLQHWSQKVSAVVVEDALPVAAGPLALLAAAVKTNRSLLTLADRLSK